jgi:membrane protein YqaA with SNARE-associated domain
VRAWFAFYAVVAAAALLPLALLAGGHDWQPARWWRAGLSLSERWDAFLAVFRQAPAAVKLLGFGLFVSLCCTFLPLPANGVVAAVATRQVAVAPTAAGTVLLVALVGALGSTVANLNEYHLFTWMLRSRHVARVRHTRMYAAAARWFGRAPFLLLVVFNILPVPIDIVRMLAITYRYPRPRFAAANFIGRFVRYAVIAAVAYALAAQGWFVAAILLGLGAALAAWRLVPGAWRRISRKPASRPAG